MGEHGPDDHDSPGAKGALNGEGYDLCVQISKVKTTKERPNTPIQVTEVTVGPAPPRPSPIQQD